MRKNIIVLAAAFACVAGGAYRIGEIEGEPKPLRCTGGAEVSNLIDRLKPLVKDADEAWYRNGIEVAFSGGDVRIILRMLDGSEYRGYAKTLDEAVARIMQPSGEIRDALATWKATHN